jgi:hypothetical protein
VSRPKCEPCFGGDMKTTCADCDREYALVDPKELAELKDRIETLDDGSKGVAYQGNLEAHLAASEAARALLRHALDGIDSGLGDRLLAGGPLAQEYAWDIQKRIDKAIAADSELPSALGTAVEQAIEMIHWYGQRLAHLSFGVDGIFLNIQEDGKPSKIALEALADRVKPNPPPPHDGLNICKALGVLRRPG